MTSTSSFVWNSCRAKGEAAEAVKKVEAHSTFPVFNISCNAVSTDSFTDYYIFFLKHGKKINTTIDFSNDIAIYKNGRK